MKSSSIQCLRALAVIGVLLFHFGDIAIGAAGVDLFFIISGFIMASVVPGKTPARFLADRAWRILPLYYVAVALEFLLTRPPLDLHRLTITATLWPVGIPYLNQSWSLSYEVFFYLGCAAFIAWGRGVLLAVPVILVGAAVLDWPLADFLGNPLILEFVGGVLLARVPRRHGWQALAAAPVALAVLWPLGIDRAFCFGLPALLFVHGVLAFERPFQARAFAPLVLLGDASYAIYLVHLTIGRLFPGTIAWTAAASAALLGGLVFHILVERRLIILLRALRPAINPVVNHAATPALAVSDNAPLARPDGVSRTAS